MEEDVADLYAEIGMDGGSFAGQQDLFLLGHFVKSRGGRKVAMIDNLFGYDDTAPAKEQCLMCEREFQPRRFAIIMHDGSGNWDVMTDRDDSSKLISKGNYTLFVKWSRVHPFPPEEVVIVPACNPCAEKLRTKKLENGKLVERTDGKKRHLLTYGAALAEKARLEENARSEQLRLEHERAEAEAEAESMRRAQGARIINLFNKKK
ncbi:MAG: hypothetical protein AAB407_01150 [Patescibacteria group bacterium]